MAMNLNLIPTPRLEAEQFSVPPFQGQQQSMQQPMPEQPQGLLGRIGAGIKRSVQDPNFMDRLTIGLGGMTMRPNEALMAVAQNRIEQPQKLGMLNEQKNRNIQALHNMNTPQAMRALQLLDAGGSISDALSMGFEKPEEKGSVVGSTELRRMFPNINIEDGLYNLKRDGTITKVGGGGVTVNTGAPVLTPFEKKAQEGLVASYSSERDSGITARKTLANVNLLDNLLSSAPTGGYDAALKTTAKKVFGIDIGDDRLTAANALIAQLVPAQRVAGSGTMSDADLALYKSSLPSIMNKPGGNAIIIRTMRGMAEYQMQMGDIASRALYGEITPQEADKLMSQLPNPLEEAMSFMDTNKIVPTTVSSIKRGG